MNFLSTILLFTITTGKVNIPIPETEKNVVVDTIWGQTVEDPYRWLEDINSVETRNWLESQSLYAQDNQGKYYHNFKDYIRLYSSIDYKPITKEGKYYFFYRTEDPEKSPILYYQNEPEESGKKLFDPNKLDKNRVISIDGLKVSPDNSTLALVLSEGRSDWKTIRFLDIPTGDLLQDSLNFVKYSPIYWSGNGIFYVSYNVQDKKQSFDGLIGGRALYYHKLGTSQADDSMIYKSKHEFGSFSFKVTPHGKYLILYYSKITDSKKTINVLYKNLPIDYNEDFKQLIVSDRKEEYYNVIGENNNRILVESNSNAPNGAIFSYDPSKTNSREVFVPQYSEKLEYVIMLYHSILRVYSSSKQSFALICDSNGKEVTSWSTPEGYRFSSFSGTVDEKKAIYHFSSFFSPGTFFQIDLETFERKPLGKTSTYFDIKDLTTETVWYYSSDSTKIPMYLTHLKSMKKNGKNPTILYGYGGFGINMEPFFDAGNLIFLKNGGILATPALRGGGEFPDWHQQGKRLNKQNTFDDFIAAAEFLVAEKYTQPEKIAAMGGSNGGLVVGAALTQRPDLFKVVISRAGVFDMLRYHKYNIGYTYEEEFGNVDDSLDFINLRNYSPYHNVKPGIGYPATLLVASSFDDRVNPFHSFKFLSQLQEKGVGENPQILYYIDKVGHSGSPVWEKRVESKAFVYSFIFDHLGMNKRIYFNFYDE